MRDFDRFKTGNTQAFSEEAVKVMENRAREYGLGDFADLLYKHRDAMRGAVSFIVPPIVYSRDKLDDIKMPVINGVKVKHVREPCRDNKTHRCSWTIRDKYHLPLIRFQGNHEQTRYEALQSLFNKMKEFQQVKLPEISL